MDGYLLYIRSSRLVPRPQSCKLNSPDGAIPLVCAYRSALAEHIGVREGDRLEISADGARLIIEPVRPTFVLSDLLVNMTPEAMPEAFDWGEEAGRERMDD
jgi:antitoxin MazE